MRRISVWLFCALISFGARAEGNIHAPETNRTFPGTGVVLEVHPDTDTIVIRHQAISNFMAAMTMPFKVKTGDALAGWRRGDKITFQLHVNATESWVDHLAKMGNETLPPEAEKPAPAEGSRPTEAPARSTVLELEFTNELGQPVRLNDFRGQALAVTFFYTRCPLPDFCPRLSKNFEAASHKLAGLPHGPTNWHFVSISFDSEFDSPAMLKAYGETYHYDPAHWSFLTGPGNEITELARACGVTYEADGATFNHNFRTLIVDATGHLQQVFITGGDLSDEIVSEIIKAAAVTNPPAGTNHTP